MLLLIQPKPQRPVLVTSYSGRLNALPDVLWRVALKLLPEQFAHFGLPLLVVAAIGWIAGDGNAINSSWGQEVTLWLGLAITIYLTIMSFRSGKTLARERYRRRAMKGN